MSDRRAIRIAVAFARQAASVPAARLCGACVDVLRVAGAGITLMSGTNVGPVCSSNERTRLLENLQFSLGEGPCHDAFMTGLVVLAPNLAQVSGGRWPNYSVPALAIGASGVFAFPLHVGEGRIGVLTVYQDEPGDLSESQTDDCVILAEVLAETIIGMQRRSERDVLVDELNDESAHRAEIHQASGVLAIQLGVDVGEALARLRAFAFSTDRSVESVAGDILAHRLRLSDDNTKEHKE